MGTDRYTSFKSNFSSQFPFWIMVLTVFTDSILKCRVRMNWLNPFKFMTGCHEPLWDEKELADESISVFFAGGKNPLLS